MSNAQEMSRYALLVGQLAAYLGIIALLDVVRPPSVPFLTLPLVAVVLIRFTAVPWAVPRVRDCEVVTSETHPHLWARVEALATQAGIHPPRVVIRDAPTANAAALGIEGVNGTIVLHRSLVEHVDDCELDGVLAHELAHLSNNDAPKSMALAVLAFYVVNTVPSLIASAFQHSRLARTVFTIVCLAGSGMTVFAFIRRTEYRADADAARTLGTGIPLADALAALSTPDGQSNNRFLSVQFPSGGLSSSPTTLLTTHPSTTHRIQRLLEIDGLQAR